MDGTTTMQGTEQEVQDTAAEMQGQQTAESTPEKVSALQQQRKRLQKKASLRQIWMLPSKLQNSSG